VLHISRGIGRFSCRGIELIHVFTSSLQVVWNIKESTAPGNPESLQKLGMHNDRPQELKAARGIPYS
jgi:hypothetical protein